MSRHLERELDALRREILLLGALVEEATQKALVALIDRRTELAAEVIENDVVVDQREVHLEEECLKVLALYQPVAADLRFVVTVLKVNNDLERVGDLAGNLAARAEALARLESAHIPQEILDMAKRVQTMLRESLDSLVELDVDLARKVLRDDDHVDEMHKALYAVLQRRMQEDSAHVPQHIQILSVSRYLERMADLATNIAEDVVFLVDGQVIRHQAT